MSCFEDENVSTIRAMRRQEELTYRCTNCYVTLRSPLSPATVVSSCSPHEAVTPQTRTILCDWANKIIDFCNLDRETVEIAMSYVDRYVQTDIGREILEHSDKFQLLVVTSLYVAIKVTETVAISAAQFEKISRNTFTAKDVESMERMLLAGLKWNLHPPTTLSFVRHYLDLIPCDVMDCETKETAFILAKIQAELATRDCSLVAVRASTIAFAALMNSFDALGLHESASGSFTVNCFVSKVASLSLAHKAVVYDETLLTPIQERLYQAIAKQSNIAFMDQSALSTPMTPKQSKPGNKSCENTPRSIIGRAV
jgi:Cyclin, N-terminal domain/Cyclin, C-terminal domain